MWRDRIIEIKKEKSMSTKTLAERSGISEETINRMLHGKTDDPRITTLSDLCGALGVEMWEIFYPHDAQFIFAQAENDALKTEVASLITENISLKNKIETLREKIDDLKDEIIIAQRNYIELKNKDK